MGVVPTHGPDCRRVASYPTKCRHCGADVFYFECTCGSKVFLQLGGKSEHVCRSGRKEPFVPYEVRTRDRIVICDQCGNRVRGDRYEQHRDLRCPRR